MTSRRIVIGCPVCYNWIMDYGRLLRDAWTITWRHRFLWVLGLFAGSSAGTCSSPVANFSFPSQWGSRSGDYGGGTGGPDFAPMTGWVNENGGFLLVLILMAVLVFFLVWLLFKVISLIAQGGMVRATADTGVGLSSSPSQALQAGLTYFWRFLGLWLLQIALAIFLAMSIAVVIATFAVVIGVLPDGVRFLPIVIAVLLGIVAVLVFIPASILFSIVVAFAQRAIVIEDIGPVSAIRTGARLIRSRSRSSLLVWLIGAGLNFFVGLIMLVVMAVTVTPLAVIGLLLNMAIGFGGPLIIYIVLALIVLVAVLGTLSAIVNAFLWSYWTIAYLRLTGREMTV
ncbi:MAG: hypothetical protein Q7O66_19305 [Dehalococcoidia bacterium]|nr:hypothetical protein [Dehalococcoidia bacterium]